MKQKFSTKFNEVKKYCCDTYLPSANKCVKQAAHIKCPIWHWKNGIRIVS